MPYEKEKRKSIIDEFFAGSLFNDMEKMFEGVQESEYSINVTQTPEGTKVHVKAGKDTDVNVLRKQLQRGYPNAEIEIEGGRSEPLIREISTKSLKQENEDQ